MTEPPNLTENEIWISAFDLTLHEHTRHTDDEDRECSNGVFEKQLTEPHLVKAERRSGGWEREPLFPH